jgi:hypothetical protein
MGAAGNVGGKIRAQKVNGSVVEPDARFPPDGVKSALLGAGMSEQVAGLMVDMQLALNEGRYFVGIRRTAESTTPTRLEDFLSQALSQDAMKKGEAH